MSTTTKKFMNILFQVPKPLKDRIELRIDWLGFSSQSDYLKYLIRKDLDQEEQELKTHLQLIQDIQHTAKDIDLSRVPSLDKQLRDDR